MTDTKTCKCCDNEKNLCEFRKHITKTGTESYENQCKKCTSQNNKIRRLKLKEDDPEAYEKMLVKRRDKDKRHYEKNKEMINERNNSYYKDNKKKIRKQRKQFAEENPEILKEQRKKFLSKTDNKLGTNLRRRTRYFLQSGKGTSKLLGCSIEYFKKWLQFNFDLDKDDLEMDFDNYGTVWELDHVYPCSKFDLEDEDEQKKAFSWENILPVSCEYNKSKNNKIVQKDLDKLSKRLTKFKKLNKQPTDTN